MLKAQYLVLPNGPLMVSLKSILTLYRKCLATRTGLLFRKLHLSWSSFSILLHLVTGYSIYLPYMNVPPTLDLHKQM